MSARRISSILIIPSLLAACASVPHTPADSAPRDTVTLTGSPGAAVHGFYVIDGNRADFSSTLPMTLRARGITVIAFDREHPADTVTADVRTPRGSMRFGLQSNDGHAAVLTIADGLSGSYASPNALNPPLSHDLILINPYWYNNTWVFDDPATGLSHEPFVNGAPALIDRVVRDLPNPRDGFRLAASEHPFPGYTASLSWVRAESGGNVYRLEGTNLQGWLCPALFRYFDHAPHTLYLKAEPSAAKGQG